MPLLDSLDDCEIMRRKLKDTFSINRMQASLIFMKILRILPIWIFKLLADFFWHNVEFVISNTQGAREPIYFQDRKLLEVSAWGPTCGISPIFVYISSYN